MYVLLHSDLKNKLRIPNKKYDRFELGMTETI